MRALGWALGWVPAWGIGPLLCAACAAPAAAPDLVYAQSARPAAAYGDMHFSDPDAWRVVHEERGEVLELFGASAYTPPHRSPHNVALVGGLYLGDFTLDVDARQTGREYGHRDLCLFFGWQDPEHFYYAHLATTPDERAHNVFLVDGAARRNLLPARAQGVDWGAGWHHLRLERRVADGLIRVYFDDLTQPVLEVRDTTFGLGRVGLGSFDDTGRFANLELRARSVAYVADDGPAFAR